MPSVGFRFLKLDLSPRLAAPWLALPLIVADLFLGVPRSADSASPGRFAATGGVPVRLDGEWEAYRGRFVDPLAFGGPGQPLPDDFSPISGRAASAAMRGAYFGTWRASLDGLEPSRLYGLAIGPFADAAVIFVDGEPALALGRPSRAAWSERDRAIGAIIPLKGTGKAVEIAVHSSGWQGGSGRAVAPPIVGDYAAIERADARSKAAEAFIAGAMAAMAAAGFAGVAGRGWLRAASACLAVAAAFGPGGTVLWLMPELGWPAAGTVAAASLACLLICLVLVSLAAMKSPGRQAKTIFLIDISVNCMIIGSALLPFVAPSTFGPATKLASIVLLAGVGSKARAIATPSRAADRGFAGLVDERSTSIGAASIGARSALALVRLAGGPGTREAGASDDTRRSLNAAAELVGRFGGTTRDRDERGFVAAFEAGPDAALAFTVELSRQVAEGDVAGARPQRIVAAVHVPADPGSSAGAADMAAPERIASAAEMVAETTAGSSLTSATLERLAAAAEAYGLSVTASGEAVEGRVGRPGFEARPIGSARVPGRDRPLAVYDVYAGDEEPARRGKERSATDFAAGLSAFRSRRFAEAIASFEKALVICPGDGPAVRYLAEARRRSEP